FSSRRRHTRCLSDWSSDVCSSDLAAPIEKLPLFVRAGSIIPLGPEKEWSTEKPEDPIELRIYRGANGDFTLYEDENDGYNYEKRSEERRVGKERRRERREGEKKEK